MGNRQQSRFLALVSSYDRYAELSEKAANAAGAGEEQFEKTLQGIEARTQQLQTSLQNLYTSAGLEKLYEQLLGFGSGILDYYNNISATFNGGILGASAAVATFAGQFANLALVITNVVKAIKQREKIVEQVFTQEYETEVNIRKNVNVQAAEEADASRLVNAKKTEEEITQDYLKQTKIRQEAAVEASKKADAVRKSTSLFTSSQQKGLIASGVGLLGIVLSSVISKDTKLGQAASGVSSIGGSIASGAGTFMMMGGPANPAAWIMGIATALPGLVTGLKDFGKAIGLISETAEERLARLTKIAEETSSAAKKAQNEQKTLQTTIDKLRELEVTRYSSEEAAKEYQTVVNGLADSYSELILGYDSAGNAIIQMIDLEEELENARKKTASATYEAALAEYNKTNEGYEQSIESLDTALGIFRFWAKLSTSADNQSSLGRENVQKLVEYFDNKVTGKQVLQDEKFYSILTAAIFEVNANYGSGAGDKQLLNDLNVLQIAFKDATQNVAEFSHTLDSSINTLSYQYALKNYQSYNFAQNSGPMRLISNQIATQFKNSGETDWNEFIKKNDFTYLAKSFDNFWEQLTEEEQELFNEMLDSSFFTFEDILSYFINYLPGYSSVLSSLSNYYEDVAEERSKKLIQRIGQIQNNTKFQNYNLSALDVLEHIITQTDIAISDNEAQLINKSLDFYLKLKEISDGKAEEYLMNFNAFLTHLNNDLNDVELTSSILQNINKNGITSVEGIQTIIDSLLSNENISEDSPLISFLIKMRDSILENIVLSIQSAIDTFSKTWSEDSKDLISLTEGIDFSKVSTIISKAKDLGLNFSYIDFIQNGEKFVLTGEAYSQYVEAYFANQKKVTDKWQPVVNKLAKLIKDEDEIDYKEILKDTDFLYQIGFKDYADYLTNTGELTEEGQKLLNKRIIQAQEDLDTYNWLITQANNQLAESLVSNGKIEAALELLGATNVESLMVQFAAGDFSQAPQAIVKVLVDYYNSINDDVYKTFMDSLSNGEATTITVTASNQKLLSNLAEKGLIKNLGDIGSTAIVNFANATVDEIKAFYDIIAEDGSISDKEKNSYLNSLDDEIISRSNSVFAEIVKSYNSFNRELAEKYRKIIGASSIEELGFNFDDTTRTYSIYITELQNLFEQAVKNGADAKTLAELQDAIQTAYKEIGNLIVSGLEGNLSRADAQNLLTQTEALGIKLNFTETVNGLRISRDSAEQLYVELLKIDKIAANIVFKQLKEELTQAGEACEDMIHTMGSIAQLEREIAKNTGETNKELEDRVKLYKQIAYDQMFDSSNYDFMNKSLPDDMQSPFTFWDNLASMRSTLTSAAENKYVDYKDYWNMLNYMHTMAQQTGKTFTLFGQQITEDWNTVSAAWEKGTKNFVANGDKTVIGLEGFGVDFEAGADAMVGNIDTGIDEFAKSQIKMLDSLINFFDGIIALEEFSGQSKELLSDNAVLDLSDVYTEGTNQLTEKAKTWLDTILSLNDDQKAAFNEFVKVDFRGKEIGIIDILQQIADGAVLTTEEIEKIMPVWSNFIKLIGSEGFDINNPYGSLTDLLSGKDFGQQLDLKLNIVQNGGTIEDAEQFMALINQALEIDGTGNITIKGESAGATFTLDVQNNGTEATITWADGQKDTYTAGKFRSLSLWLKARAKEYAQRNGLIIDDSQPITIDSISTNATITNGEDNAIIGVNILYATKSGELGKVKVGTITKTFGPSGANYNNAEDAFKNAAADYMAVAGKIEDYTVESQSVTVTNENGSNIDVSITYTDDSLTAGTIRIGEFEEEFGPNSTYKSAAEALSAVSRDYNDKYGSGTLSDITLDGKNITVTSANDVTYIFTLAHDPSEAEADIGEEWSKVNADIVAIVGAIDSPTLTGETFDITGSTKDGYTVALDFSDINGTKTITYTFKIDHTENAKLSKEAIQTQWKDAQSDIAELKDSIDNLPDNATITRNGDGTYTVDLKDISIGGNATLTYSFTLQSQDLTNKEVWDSKIEDMYAAKVAYEESLSNLAKDLGITNFKLTAKGVHTGTLSTQITFDGITAVSCDYDINWSNDITPDTANEKINFYREELNTLIKNVDQFKADYGQGVEDETVDNTPIDLFPQPILYNATKTIEITQSGYDVFDENGKKLGHYDSANAYNAVIAAFNSEVDAPLSTSSLSRTAKETEWNAQHIGETNNYEGSYETFLENQAKKAEEERRRRLAFSSEVYEPDLEEEKELAEKEIEDYYRHWNAPIEVSKMVADAAEEAAIETIAKRKEDYNAFKAIHSFDINEYKDIGVIFNRISQLKNFERAGVLDNAGLEFLQALQDLHQALVDKKEQEEKQKQTDAFIENANKALIVTGIPIGMPMTGGGGVGSLLNIVDDPANKWKVFKTGEETITQAKIGSNIEAIEGQLENLPVQLAQSILRYEATKTEGTVQKSTINEQNEPIPAKLAQLFSLDGIIDAITNINESLGGRFDNLVSVVTSVLNTILAEMPQAGSWYNTFDGISVHGDFWGEGNQLVLPDGNGGNMHLNLKDYVTEFANSLKEIQSMAANTTATVDVEANTAFAISRVNDLINNINSRTARVKVTAAIEDNTTGEGTKAKGNTALAKGTRTLMGELGPELWVSGGRYYVAGQNGAEFVNLPDDAIVFNHLQTQRLLGSGSTGRGKPVTNERRAVSYAKGNMNGGPAMASAKEVRAQLVAIRDIWTSLLNKNFSDLVETAGAGGGGGGGSEEVKKYLYDLDRWYNLLRQISKVEEQITYQQKLRANMKNGGEYVRSLEYELALLEKERSNYQMLSDLQKSYYDARRRDQEQSIYSYFFTYDDEGLMQYNDEAFKMVADLNRTDTTGQAINTSQEQIDTIVAALEQAGYSKSLIETTLYYNESGEQLKDAADIIQNFYDKYDGWIDEMDSIYDSYNEYQTKVQELISEQNEILEEYRDLQLNIEQQLLEAIENREQAIIDKLQDETDALRDASDKYINGLTDALNKERELYQQNEEDKELLQLQRRLAILQRSGGSASSIQSLQDQINSKMQDKYFETQQSEIDAIKEASDKQLEMMQSQIDLMTETLEYQKENGLFWGEVTKWMTQSTPEEVARFIKDNNAEYLAQSNAARAKSLEETVFELEKWYEHMNSNEIFSKFYDAITNQELERYGIDTSNKDIVSRARATAHAAYQKVYNDAISRGADILTARQEAQAAALAALQSDASLHPVAAPTVEGGADITTSTNTKTTKNYNNSQKEMSESEKIANLQSMWDASKKGVEAGVNAVATSKVTEQIKTSTIETTLSGLKVDSSNLNDILKKAQNSLRITKYSSGGMNDYTGLAMLHGTPTRPEAVLNSEQTHILKNDILGKSNNSLLSLLVDFREALDGIVGSSEYNSIDRGESLVIENASVNMNVASIANDYDAKRAGETALEEMLRIARKTGAQAIRR